MNLIEAIINHDAVKVQELLEEGVDPDMIIDESMLRPLHFAAQENQVEIGELLIRAGANVHARTFRDEETPLEIATLHNNKEFIALLLKHSRTVEVNSDYIN